MQSEEPQLSSYNFRFTGGDSNTYVFETGSGSSYEITFKPSGYLFDEQDAFRDDVYEFSINLISHKSARLPLTDPLIAPTVVGVFQDFHDKHGLVVIYICDSSDNRQLVRYRKFGIWFHRYRHLGFIKMDVEIDDPRGTIYTSLLMHRQYRYRDEAVLAFLRITDRENPK